ncbi:hypothetical protein NDN08_005847 [Rhodosorus marinus]|uniref:Uncharacterized protein n=1 Tax=Rhodosorus marinus TaxID=101924 RepID=A0AAV8V2R8_9RHOD|nr:hypothetical protein NDN08_005847 [Rhodosorus marinus]
MSTYQSLRAALEQIVSCKLFVEDVLFIALGLKPVLLLSPNHRVSDGQVQRVTEVLRERAVRCVSLDGFTTCVVNVDLVSAKLSALESISDLSKAHGLVCPRVVDVRRALRSPQLVNSDDRFALFHSVKAHIKSLLTGEQVDVDPSVACVTAGWLLDYPSLYYPSYDGNCLSEVALRLYRCYTTSNGRTDTIICSFSTPSDGSSTEDEDEALMEEYWKQFRYRVEKKNLQTIFPKQHHTRSEVCLSHVAL